MPLVTRTRGAVAFAFESSPLLSLVVHIEVLYYKQGVSTGNTCGGVSYNGVAVFLGQHGTALWTTNWT